MRQKLGFVLLLVIVFTASYLRPLQEGARSELQPYTYAQITQALADAGLEPTIRAAGAAGVRPLSIAAAEHHRLTVGQTGMDLFLLQEGDLVRSTVDGLTIERADGSVTAIPASMVGGRYAMHRANLLLLLDSADPSEIAQIIEALARLR